MDALSHVLVVNAGSSSLRLGLLGPGDEVLADEPLERWEGAESGRLIGDFIDGLPARPEVVAHRLVHGGSTYTAAVVVDDAALTTLDSLVPLAPLHQPRALAALRAVSAVLPDVPQVACFDTAFHATIPDAAHTYAVPRSWRETYGLRRYGFHGLSHAYASRRAAELDGRPLEELRMVTCHLGSGSSLAAVAGGRSVDTTMGFTPLEGLVMRTRSGTVDPGMVTWLLARMPAEEVDAGLMHGGGLAGLSGTSGDARDVAAAEATGDPSARLAREVWTHRLRQEVAAMAASLGGIDALVMTGGMGEHATAWRGQALAGLRWLGVAIDPTLNDAAHGDADISGPGATVRTYVVTAREDLEMAREARALLT